MIAILYPLKMTKNLYEAYSKIYEVSADFAIKAAKKAEKKRADSAKAGDTEGAKKAIGQNKKFFSYAKKKRQIENMPKKPTGPMASKPVVDYSKPYPGTGKKKVEEDTKAMKDFLDKKAKKLEDEKKNQKPEYKNNPAFGDPSHHSNAKSKNEAYDNVGKFRKEWETNKLVEKNNYREKFDTWLEGIVEEGYDIERWTDQELVDTFIHENDLWKSKDSVMSALVESDKKGKGSGKKDACYHKVKASASVWPSAYASGRLVQCRKKGAANYGKSKKEDFSDWKNEISLNEMEEKGNPKPKVKKLKPNYKHQRYAGSMKFVPFDKVERLDDKIAKAKEDRAKEKHEKGKRAFKMLDKPVKESVYSDWRDDLGLITEYTGAIQAAAKPVTKAIVRAGIRVGGKTGGKVTKEVIKGAGTAAKDAAMNAAAKVGAGAVNKVVDTVKPKPKQLPKEVSPANPR